MSNAVVSLGIWQAWEMSLGGATTEERISHEARYHVSERYIKSTDRYLLRFFPAPPALSGPV